MCTIGTAPKIQVAAQLHNYELLSFDFEKENWVVKQQLYSSSPSLHETLKKERFLCT